MVGMGKELADKVKRRVHYRRWFKLALRSVLGFLGFLLVASFLHTGWDLWCLKQEEARVTRAVQVLKAQNQELREQMQRMQEDEYIERAAREQLGLVKPGEVLYYLTPAVPSDTRNP